MNNTAAWLTFAGTCVTAVFALAAVYVGQKGRTDTGRMRDELKLPSNGSTPGAAIESIHSTQKPLLELFKKHLEDEDRHVNRRHARDDSSRDRRENR